MRSLTILIIAVALLGGDAVAQTPAPTMPDTPAGHMLGAWLEVFNSGDGDRIQAFIAAHVPKLSLETAERFRAHSGGYDLVAIEKSEPDRIVYRIQERAQPAQVIGTLRLGSADPNLISQLRVFAAPPGAKFEDVAVDAAVRTRLVDAVLAILEQNYVFADVARQMAAAVRARARQHAFDGIVDGEDFAEMLTGELQKVSHDKHLVMRFNPVVTPMEEPRPQPAVDPRTRTARDNCGFELAEHLQPNIGYLKFNGFADPQVCGATAEAALRFVADSDVLILDLRDNHGGMGDMVTLIASYLFDEPTHLNDAYMRKDNVTVQTWTLPSVPGKRFIGKPVFVLTSRGTFSAAEDLSFALKNLKRATLIGETTGGGAHMVEPHRIDAHFSIDVPFARSISPITKTDWEGIGVEPDIRVPAADALTEALRRARGP